MATTLLIYSVISGATLSLLWGTFRLAGVDRLTCHRLNRLLLLFILIVSVVLPVFAFLELPETEEPDYEPIAIELPEVAPVYTQVAEITLDVTPPPAPADYSSIIEIVSIIYIIGALGSLLWLLTGLIGVIVAIFRGEKRRLDSHTTLVIHTRNITPFTWGRWIFISRADLESNAEMLLSHESAHKAAAHWVDLILARLVACIDWYWPTAWLLIRDLAAIHEYQADSRVLQDGTDAVAYQMLLINKGATGTYSNITNPFNYSSLKNRITMMQKKQSSARSLMRTLALLPAAAVAILLASAPALASAVQNALPEPVEANEGVSISEQDLEDSMPQFPGGDTALYNFLSKNIHYPEEAIEQNASGRVSVQFKVGTDGKVSGARAIKNTTGNYALSREAVRIIESLPNFIPAKHNGVPVTMWYTLPINFGVTDDPEADENNPIPNLGDFSPAEFPGGDEALYKYLSEHIQYPETAADSGAQGRVVVQFLVTEDGSVGGAFVIENNTDNYALTNEAIRVVNSLPKFKPATKNGKHVNIYYTLPINFGLVE